MVEGFGDDLAAVGLHHLAHDGHAEPEARRGSCRPQCCSVGAASSALVIGAIAGSPWRPPEQVTGVLLAFASGALISALAFELFEEECHLGGAVRSGLGLVAGAAAGGV